MTNLFDLTGKTAVAIGGNSVLGSSMAKGLADQGAQVAVVGRNLETAEKVVQEIVERRWSCKSISGRCYFKRIIRKRCE